MPIGIDEALYFSRPNVVWGFLGFRLGKIRQAIEHIHGFVLPVSMLEKQWIDPFQCRPKAHCAVSYGQFRCVHATAFQRKKNLPQALRRLASSVPYCQTMLLTTGIDADDNKGVQLVMLTAQAAVNSVSPDVDPWLLVQRLFAPTFIFPGPFPFQARYRIGRKPLGVWSKQNLQSGPHLAAGNTFQVQPRQGRFQ